MKKCSTNRAGSVIAGLLAGLAPTLPALAADANVPAQYGTIQAAVNASSSGDTIHIAPGIYVEQVTITNKHLTVAGAPGTVIRAKAGMAQTLHGIGGTPRVALLGIALSDVVVKGITFEGEHLADGLPDGGELVGIYFWGSGGQVTNCTVMGFRGIAMSGDAEGILGGNPVGLGTPAVRVLVRNSTFADNHNSIGFYGDHSQPTLLRVTVAIEGNIITGIGPTDTGTQAGIGVQEGAGGVVRRNIVADHSYTGTELSFSQGITSGDAEDLEPGQPIVYEGNTLQRNQLGLVSLRGNGRQILDNTFLGPGTGYRSLGISVTGEGIRIASNRFSNLPMGILLIGNDPDFGTALGITTNTTLIGNRFCDVTTPIEVEPLVTGTTNQGTLMCPFPRPALGIVPAVLLNWPDYSSGWILEFAPMAMGPWQPADVMPTLHGGQNTAVVKSDTQHRFFRLTGD